MDSKDGTLEIPQSITAPTVTTFQKTERKELCAQWNFSRDTEILQLSSVDIATNTGRDLTHALLNLSPVTPFNSIINKQLDALRTLFNIFTGIKEK